MDKNKKSIITKVVLVICIVAFLISAFFVVKYFVDKHNSEKAYEELQNKVEQTTEPTTEEPKPDYSEAVEKNAETVGWITIPGTNVNFPVVQTIDNSYYMNHNFENKKEFRGAIFMDYRNDPVNLDANTIIYGHNAYDGTVFSDIDNYRDIDYFKEHPVIEFNTLDKYYKWKIYAVFVTNQIASEDNGYIFNYIYPHLEGENFEGYIEEVNKRTLYHTGVDIEDGDKLLTLQSCTRVLDLSNYRAKTSIVVLARAVREGEDESVDVSKAVKNENPKYPQLYYKKHGIENPYKNDEKWYPVEVQK